MLSTAEIVYRKASDEAGTGNSLHGSVPQVRIRSRPARRVGLRLARSLMGLAAFLTWFGMLSVARYLDVGPAHTLFVHFVALGGLFVYIERAIGLHDMEQAVNLRVAFALAVAAMLIEALILLVSFNGWRGAHSIFVVGAMGGGMLAIRSGLVLVCRALVRTGVVAKTVVVVGPESPLRDEVLVELDSLVGVRTVAVHSGDDFQPLAEEMAAGPVDEVILVASEPLQLQPIVDGLEVHAIDLLFIAPMPAGPVERRLRFRSPIEHGRVLQDRRQSGGSYLIKRAIDVTLSATALVVLAPLLLAIAIAVRLDSPGPALFKQTRFGYGGREFLMWKFRSMRTDAADHSGSTLTKRNDDRVTRLGGFLRSSSLDELPQLVNILIGELSIVGPRPHPSGAKAGDVLYDELIGNFKARYRVRPGLTGLAQCSGLRGNTDTEAKLISRFEKDMEYVETWTILRDIEIMLKTVAHLVGRENAY
jgi:exopolysaccharide biosynthesis polyprenyl glycosylphosphotransferase